MILTLEARSSCVCGYQFTSACCPDFVINRRSVRQKPGPYLSMGEFVPRGLASAPRQPGESGCPECGFRPPAAPDTIPLPAGCYVASAWQYNARSLAEIEAYRARRWPG